MGFIPKFVSLVEEFTPLTYSGTSLKVSIIDASPALDYKMHDSRMSEKMTQSSLKDKGYVPASDKRVWLEELKRASPRKKSHSAKLKSLHNGKLLSKETGGSMSRDIKMLLQERLRRKEQVDDLSLRKLSNPEGAVSMPPL